MLSLVVGAVWFGAGTPSAVVASERNAPSETLASDPTVLVVHVSGAVARPGLVHVEAGARAADVVAAAGGALRTADLGRLNLAAPVRDAEHLHVPHLDQSGAAPGSSRLDGIDLNTADASELQQLPGVGPVLAARIVAYRDDHGRFETVEDLLDVPGIGEAKLAQLRESIGSP